MAESKSTPKDYENNVGEELPKGLLAIHVKLNLLWLLLGDIAIVTGFPQHYRDILCKEWEKVNQ